ncbi:aminoacyl-tRNA hydrolase [Tepidiforma sp.]|uniref:aminoacyl-tRNA hydrolase n=1 Tax=Tepidiforma sp. TaxID=2682230 RepID=UPI002ADD79BC|nr:aminoacyl-tRNA hydrolase [Tepidiforma sp.]
MPFRRKPAAAGPRFAADWLVVGLGNPGEQYARTRHNVGFWVVNTLARRAGTQPKAVGSLMHIGVGTLHGHQVALVRPKTYMNLSGRAVAQALQWTGCDLAHTIVAYDDLDLPPGQIRVRAGGGHGGHNGLKSIAQHAGLEFIRVRIGIGRPLEGGQPTWDPEIVADWVLSPPSPTERELLEAAVQRAADAIETILTDGVEAAATAYNRKA